MLLFNGVPYIQLIIFRRYTWILIVAGFISFCFLAKYSIFAALALTLPFICLLLWQPLFIMTRLDRRNLIYKSLARDFKGLPLGQAIATVNASFNIEPVLYNDGHMLMNRYYILGHNGLLTMSMVRELCFNVTAEEVDKASRWEKPVIKFTAKYDSQEIAEVFEFEKFHKTSMLTLAGNLMVRPPYKAASIFAEIIKTQFPNIKINY